MIFLSMKKLFLFSNDLTGTLKNYATYEFARNSPIFFILLSLLKKIGLGIEIIRYINIVSVFLIIYFLRLSKIKYDYINSSILKILH